MDIISLYIINDYINNGVSSLEYVAFLFSWYLH